MTAVRSSTRSRPPFLPLALAAPCGTICKDPSLVTTDVRGCVSVAYRHEPREDASVTAAVGTSETFSAEPVASALLGKARITGGGEHRNLYHLRLEDCDVEPDSPYQNQELSRESIRIFLRGEIPLHNLPTLLATRLAPGLSLSASVCNLLDREYADPASLAFLQDGLEQDGRTFAAKLVWSF